MITYITAFIFYTLAMVGILLVGFVVYKKTFQQVKSENKGMIKILDSCTIAPKKALLVVRVRNEKFLIASDAERTTFLSKLADENQQKQKHSEKPIEIDGNLQREIQEAINEKTVRYDDIQKSRVDEIQRQFMELYSKDEPKQQPIQQTEEISERKKMIRKFINELNNKKVNSGSKN